MKIQARYRFVLLSQKGKIGKEHIMQSGYMVLHRNHNFMRPRLIKDIKGENIVFFFSKNSTLGRWVWWIIALAFIVADLAPKHCKLGCSSKQGIIADGFKVLPKVNLFLHAYAKIKICHRFINFRFIKISCK